MNPGVNVSFATELADLYVDEAAKEGINHDIAFAQMCLETGYLKYGRIITPDMNNFCGLGASGPGYSGARFPTERAGVQAHIQHLKAYATTAPLNQPRVDPHFDLVKRGSAPTIEGLTGKWAIDNLYDIKIKGILERLYQFALRFSVYP
jgi:hypothetical protein